jgi:hypothetical protein
MARMSSSAKLPFASTVKMGEHALLFPPLKIQSEKSNGESLQLSSCSHNLLSNLLSNLSTLKHHLVPPVDHIIDTPEEIPLPPKEDIDVIAKY